MPKPGKPIPDEYHTITPHLIVQDTKAAIEWYKKVFGATERGCMPAPDGKIIHGEIKIGNSILMMFDEMPAMSCFAPGHLGGTPVGMHLYFEDADAVFNKAVEAGATVQMPMMDAFWGDRYGKVKDPFGHEWAIATHKWDLSEEEIQKAAQEAFAQWPCPQTS
ncbi:MAG: VOC family protein [Verrucomicrobiales bacterium]